jgi:hypothetical protein
VTDEIPDEDEAGAEWATGLAKEWAADLEDPRQDIYDYEDGDPVPGESVSTSERDGLR